MFRHILVSWRHKYEVIPVYAVDVLSTLLACFVYVVIRFALPRLGLRDGEQLVRNKTWNHVLNACTILNLALPMLEVQRCLPCMGPQPVVHHSDALWQGRRNFPRRFLEPKLTDILK